MPTVIGLSKMFYVVMVFFNNIATMYDEELAVCGHIMLCDSINHGKTENTIL